MPCTIKLYMTGRLLIVDFCSCSASVKNNVKNMICNDNHERGPAVPRKLPRAQHQICQCDMFTQKSKTLRTMLEYSRALWEREGWKGKCFIGGGVPILYYHLWTWWALKCLFPPKCHDTQTTTHGTGSAGTLRSLAREDAPYLWLADTLSQTRWELTWQKSCRSCPGKQTVAIKELWLHLYGREKQLRSRRH